MTKLFNLKASLIVAAVLAAPLAQAANMNKADYKAGKERISASYKADKATCGPLAGNAKDVCVLEAKGKEKVAKAELEYSYTGKAGDQTKLAKARAEATYKVAKEKCDDLAGNAKDVCVKEAKATETAALADAKMGKKVGEARTEAVDDKRDAAYKLANEKCDALAGDAKNACVADAKAKFGKN
ncbi:MAG: hypothetical protein H7Y33_11465 [Cytophagales bacterium]|nr:hypothetical protein [Rhizobacter sp.]